MGRCFVWVISSKHIIQSRSQKALLYFFFVKCERKIILSVYKNKKEPHTHFMILKSNKWELKFLLIQAIIYNHWLIFTDIKRGRKDTPFPPLLPINSSFDSTCRLLKFTCFVHATFFTVQRKKMNIFSRWNVFFRSRLYTGPAASALISGNANHGGR
jgi:hypothetical protein